MSGLVPGFIFRMPVRFTRGATLRLVLVAGVSAGFAGSATAADYTWSGGAGGTWDTSATNWTGAAGTPWDSTNGTANKAIFSTAGDSAVLSGAVYPGYVQATTSATIGNGGTASNAIGYATDGSSKTIEAATGTTTTINANINYGGTGTNGNNLLILGGGTVALGGTATLVSNVAGNKSSYFSIEGGSTLNVKDGGYLATMQTMNNSNSAGASGNTFMGGASGNNVLRVSGTNGKLVTGNFNVGSSGNNGNSVYISAPGTSNAASPAGAGASVASWLLSANGAQLNLNSSNNYVEISNGAFVQHSSGGGTSAWNIGNGAGQDGNQIKVTGLGSTVSRGTSGYINAGGNATISGGSNNSVVVEAGGLWVGGRVGAGYGNTGITTANNYFLITGTSDGTSNGTPSYYRLNGSSNGHFLVGGSNLATGNSFRVEAGARTDIFGTGTGKNLGIGMVAGADNNYVKVTGAGSVMNFITGQELTVGGNASTAGGADCRIDIYNGGSLVMGNTNNSIPLPATVSWTTWAAIPTTGTALVLAGTNATVNLGDGNAISRLKVGTVNGHSGVELAVASSRLNVNNGRLQNDSVTGNLVSGPGQMVLNGPAYVEIASGASNTISSLITGTGSLTKEGTGLLVINNLLNTYSGNTTISAGTLSLTGAFLADAGSVSIASGALLDLNFSGTDAIGSLIINGTAQPSGTYNAANLGSYLMGTGSLQVAAVPEPATLALAAVGGLAIAALARRRKSA